MGLHLYDLIIFPYLSIALLNICHSYEPYLGEMLGSLLNSLNALIVYSLCYFKSISDAFTLELYDLLLPRGVAYTLNYVVEFSFSLHISLLLF